MKLTVYDRVEAVAVFLVSTRLQQRAAGHAVALRVAHVGAADAATVWAQELVNTCAVLTWHINTSSSDLALEHKQFWPGLSSND